jgi:hypothetical protein
VAITVMNGTLASRGRLAMYATARPTSLTSMVGSTRIDPSGWRTPSAIRAVIGVSALPMSIWPQAMSWARPSRAVVLVSPVIACFVAMYGLLRAEERTGEVDVDHALPVGQLEFLEGHGRSVPAGVVDQEVEPAVGLADGGEQGLHRSRVGDVGGDGEAVVTGGPELAGEVVQRLWASPREHHGPAVARQREGDGAPDTRTSTGDDGDLVDHEISPRARRLAKV